MENFIFSLNVVMPIFLLISIGYFLKTIKLVNPSFTKIANNVTFKVFLPVLLFRNIYNADFSDMFDANYILLVLGLVFAQMILLFLTVPLIVKKNAQRGVVIQALFRGNFLIFGVPICQAMFGDKGAALAAIVATFLVPLYNVLAVVVLSIYDCNKKISIKRTVFSILTNPLIIGALLGIVFSLIRAQIPGFAFPQWVSSPLEQIGGIATPLALILLGCDFSFRGAFRNIKYVLSVSILRLITFPCIAIAIAAYLGMRNEQIAILMVAFGAPVAVSSYTMACNVNSDSELAGQLVVATSLFSIFTMFGLVYMTKMFGLI